MDALPNHISHRKVSQLISPPRDNGPKLSKSKISSRIMSEARYVNSDSKADNMAPKQQGRYLRPPLP